MTPDDMINDVLGLDEETLQDQEFYIGEIFDGIYPPAAAIWCNSHNAYIDVIGEKRYEIKTIPDPYEPTYAEKRAAEYPSVGDQLDMIYWDRVNGTNLWQEKIAEIKAKYPKE